MRIIDLSHEIYTDMPVYPGDRPPVVTDEAVMERDKYNEKRLSLSSHTGTHIDAPAHMIPDGANLDAVPLEVFIGPGLIIDVSNVSEPEIAPRVIAPYLEDLEPGCFILFRTGWDRYWGRDEYFHGFPVLSTEAAELTAALSPKGVGFDAVSADPTGSTTLPVHRLLLSQGIILIENLTNLDSPPTRGFIFTAMPLKIKAGDGSPVRAAAVIM